MKRARAAKRTPRRRSLRPGALFAAGAAVSMLAAGCGGGSKAPSVASLGTTTQGRSGSSASAPLSPQQEKAVDDAYVACLNAHGAEARVMPGGGVGLITTPASQGPVAAARKSCRELLPKGGLPAPTPSQIDQRVAQMLKLAECMRSHGVLKFPDPTANGSLMINPSSGVDPQSPSFQQAQKACGKDFPGGSPP